MNSALLAYICILSIGYCLPVLDAFVPNVHVHVDVRKHTRTIRTNPLYAANKDEKNKSNKKGYQFGDITKNLISKVTKKDDYEFGDLSKSIDKTVKDKVATMSGKDKDSYEFGDLSRLVDSRVKEQVNDFTNQTSYKFGDVSKEILVRVKTRDYTMDDMIILFKILLAFGAGLSPVASFLPAKLLIELLDYSILGDLSNKVTTAITQELDQRMKKAFTGDADYQLGDMSKKAVLKYIGKDEYAFGDITNFVVDSVGEKKENERERQENEKASAADGVSDPGSKEKEVKASILGGVDGELIAKELEQWDKQFIKEVELELDDSMMITRTNSTTNSTSPK